MFILTSKEENGNPSGKRKRNETISFLQNCSCYGGICDYGAYSHCGAHHLGAKYEGLSNSGG